MHNDPNQPVPAPGQKVQVSAAAFAAKYRSKREVYNFLAVDSGVYLPSYGKYLEPWPITMQESRMAAELYFRTFRRSPAIIYGAGVTSYAAVLQVVKLARVNPPG